MTGKPYHVLYPDRRAHHKRPRYVLARSFETYEEAAEYKDDARQRYTIRGLVIYKEKTDE